MTYFPFAPTGEEDLAHAVDVLQGTLDLLILKSLSLSPLHGGLLFVGPNSRVMPGASGPLCSASAPSSQGSSLQRGSVG